jgi:hypothetical protein
VPVGIAAAVTVLLLAAVEAIYVQLNGNIACGAPESRDRDSKFTDAFDAVFA